MLKSNTAQRFNTERSLLGFRAEARSKFAIGLSTLVNKGRDVRQEDTAAKLELKKRNFLRNNLAVNSPAKGPRAGPYGVGAPWKTQHRVARSRFHADKGNPSPQHLIVMDFMQGYLLIVTLLWIFSTRRAFSQFFGTTLDALRSRSQCDCMEYWQCIGSGGKPYSYCSYSNKVCCFIDPNSVAIGILPRPTKSGSCGTKGPNSERDGISEPGEWAWHAAVLEKPQDLYVCGASLVDEYWVITAAHCVDEYRSPSALKIRLGEHDVSSTAEPFKYEEFDVSRIVVYPTFNNRTLNHDIALVRLSKPAKKRANINVVCMPSEGTTNNELILSPRCFVTGWGKTIDSTDHSVVLKEINVPLWRNDDCERALKFHFGPTYKLPATSLCAGAEGRDACDGDGGGPLVCEMNGHWYQVGVVSFGIGCGQPNTPGIYTRVESYSSWIHRVVAST